MIQRLRWGILGTGMIAWVFTRDLVRSGGEVVAVGSRTPESAAAFAAKFDLPRAYGSYEDLIADPEVDVIYIATPHPFHADNAILALDGGKHALVEKAFTINRAQAEAVIAAAARNDRVVLEALWTRYLPHMRRIHEIVGSGSLGEVRALLADHDQKLSTDPRHRLQDPELGGGALLDLGVYPVSFAHDLFGPPSVVHAISTPTPTGVDQQTAVILGFPSGQQAVLHTLLDAQGPVRASVIGTEARIDVDANWYEATGFSVVAPDGTVIERYESAVEGRGMQYEAEALEALVQSGEGLPPLESVAVMGTLDEIRRQIGLSYPGE